MVAGARSYVAVGQWAAHAPAGVLAALQARVPPRTGHFVPPCESTLRRTWQACDGDQIDAVLGAWLYPRLPADHVTTVEGKTLRGARAGDGRAVHLLAAMLGQTRAAGPTRDLPQTSQITAFAPLLEDLDLSRGAGQRRRRAQRDQRPATHADPQQIDTTLRGHWGIDNGLHYVRDVTFAEDASRVRTRSGPRIMASPSPSSVEPATPTSPKTYAGPATTQPPADPARPHLTLPGPW